MRGMRNKFCEKEFLEINEEEMRAMRRVFNYRIDINDLLDHYKITIDDYLERIEELHMHPTSDERKKWQQDHPPKPMAKTPPKDILTKHEMIAIRLYRGMNRFQLAKLFNSSEPTINMYETGRTRVPVHWQEKYIAVLKVKYGELKRIRAALAGETKGLETDREIPYLVKLEVSERDKNKCARCPGTYNLHYHHKKRYSEGGLHTAGNIEMLCAECHAEEHIGEICYWLLKRKIKA